MKNSIVAFLLSSALCFAIAFAPLAAKLYKEHRQTKRQLEDEWLKKVIG